MESVGLMEVVGDGFSRRYSCYSVTVENGCFDRFDVDRLICFMAECQIGHFGHLSFCQNRFSMCH